MKKILFICKKNDTYGFISYTRRSSGLYNSTRFIAESLNTHEGIDARIVEVIDNNDIDREVAHFRPSVVVIEALWVVPEKFEVLSRLHPDVRWFVHLHSHMPFLALEGIAMEWIFKYPEFGVELIANSRPSFDALRTIVPEGFLHFLPNVYLPTHKFRCLPEKEILDIGCFGAVRPLKNQLLQAMAAIQFGEETGKPIRFHLNGTRQETGGAPVLKNIRKLFQESPMASLVQHAWYNPEEFHQVLEGIDIGLQVSLTETFNVVSADYVTCGVPVVASKEVSWISSACQAKDDDINSIVGHMHRVYRNALLVWLNRRRLDKYSAKAQRMWLEFVRGMDA